jgi:Domain of unknown function (DUF4105)
MHNASPGTHRWLRAIAISLAWLGAGLLTVWALAAVAIDIRIHWLRFPATILYAAVLLFVLAKLRGHARRLAACVLGFLLVLSWWLTLKPSNNRPWQPDVSQTPWAEVNGDQITIHNFRNCDYRTEFDYTCQWLDKTVSLPQLRGVDVAITYWGSADIAHPIVSFQFGDNDYVATSIETRKEIGEGYSAVLGFFRHYELLYIFADERDLIRLRTNYRKDEEVYLFHTTAGAQWSRKLFLAYIQRANRLHSQAEWYNAMTSNCTTNIFQQMALTGSLPAGSALHDWRVLLNGKGDEMLYKGGNFAGNIPFPELKESAHINNAARAVDHDLNFSRRIRQGRPGFDTISSASSE